MAQTIKGLCRVNFCLAKNVFFKNNPFNARVRFLYTDRAIGITAYEQARKMFLTQFSSVSEIFRAKMLEVCKTPSSTIFTEDMKAMVHLINNNEEDIQLVEAMLQKYRETNRDMQFGTYVFGPVVMRMYTYLQEPRRAYESFNNLFETSFYKQMTTVQVLLNLLYKYEMYQEIKVVYEKISSTDSWKGMANRCMFDLMAGCYKENTKESLDYGAAKWKELMHQGIKPSARGTSLLAYLAINQNSPELALETLCAIQNQKLASVVSLKCLACTYLKRYVNLITLIKPIVFNDQIVMRRNFFKEVLFRIEQFILSNPSEGSEDTLKLINDIKTAGKIIETTTLEDVLLRPYDTVLPSDQFKNESIHRNNHEQRKHYNEVGQYARRKFL
ncbi:pentatricopeptide repeat-containing protein 2, mitochondrial [Nomia melanderi]|uniref:pentatricopeptide repeat-containing protein 2, mitochondrial n=1 Tax=Nomia melanderi TaxID=2448451 RepID=UPI0013044CF4|nr:pentatricopeptide repeat-containing protein 2, mitochondrial-like [Nomia melanderi]